MFKQMFYYHLQRCRLIKGFDNQAGSRTKNIPLHSGLFMRLPMPVLHPDWAYLIFSFIML